VVRADYQGGRQRWLYHRVKIHILATDLMAQASGGHYVEQTLRLIALGMAHENRGGSQPRKACECDIT
jgi:hypothetical protein